MKKISKLLFVHSSEKVKEDINKNFYTDGSYNNEVWKRYLNISTKLTFAAKKDSRVYSVEDAISKFNYISKEINYIELKNLTASVKSIFSISKRCYNNKILRELVKENDFIIVRVPCEDQGKVIKYCKKYNKSYMVELVGCPWDAYWNHSIKGKLVAPIMYLSTKKVVRNSPNTIYVSRRFLQERYPTKGYQISCPDVILEKPDPKVLDKRLKKIERRSRESVFILGLIGSMDVNYRGHETVIQAIFELKNRGFHCKVRFLGPGSGNRWIYLADKLGIGDRIEICGVLPSGLPVLQWIDGIDILTMPTQQETLGRAIIEAMGRGCPVIGSLETAIGEQIGSDCLCHAKDKDELANIIERMIVDNDYLKYCSQENFYRAYKYSNEQTNNIRNNFYRKLLSELIY